MTSGKDVITYLQIRAGILSNELQAIERVIRGLEDETNP
jgi:hypothetical protein